MKQILSTVLIVLCTFFSANAKEKTDTLSYMIGLQVSNDIENNIPELAQSKEKPKTPEKYVSR